MNVLLGLDIGTTNCKVLAVDEDGQPVASAAAPTPLFVDSTPDATPEYDPNGLWHVSARLIREVVALLGSDQTVAGIAVASVGESIVLVDQENVPLAPIIIWHDKRTLPWLDWWRQRISDRELYRITGLNLGYIYSANKLLWYREHQPDLFRRARSFLSIADWITLCLSGQRSMSCGLASRTLLFDVRARVWSNELLRLTGIPSDMPPPVLASGQAVGGITRHAGGHRRTRSYVRRARRRGDRSRPGAGLVRHGGSNSRRPERSRSRRWRSEHRPKLRLSFRPWPLLLDWRHHERRGGRLDGATVRGRRFSSECGGIDG